MATSFAAQLSRIAATSSHELDLRARRTLHSESLLFPQDVAAKQSFDSIYALCFEGFQDLCQLDARFRDFNRNLFSQQAKEQDRDQMNKSENDALDTVIESFLSLLGARLLLNPAVRALEWLVRRFRVHVHNTPSLILTTLCYHDAPIWRNIISIIPANKLVGEWKWTAPYKRDSLNVPRHAIVHAFTNNDGFWTKLNTYIIDSARTGHQHSSLLQFWSGIMVEAVIARLSAARSGRNEVQRERMQDALLKILPLVSDGFEIKGCSDLTTALFTLAMILAARADLDDRVLDSLLQAIANFIVPAHSQTRSAIVATAVLVAQKQKQTIPRQSVDAFKALPHLEEDLQMVANSYSLSALIEGLVAGVLSSLSGKKRNSAIRINFLERLLHYCNAMDATTTLRACFGLVLAKVSQLAVVEGSAEQDTKLALQQALQRFVEDDQVLPLLLEAATEAGHSQEDIEAMVGSTIGSIEASAPDADSMELDLPQSRHNLVDDLLASAPSRTADVTSFLATNDSQLFDHLFKTFELCCKGEQDLERFVTLSIWSSATSGQLLLLSFYLRVASSSHSAFSRVAALRLLSERIRANKNTDIQIMIPYVLAALGNTSSSVRQAASDVLIALAKLVSQDHEGEQFGREELYSTWASGRIKWISNAHMESIFRQVLIPSIEEFILDPAEIERVVEFAINGSSNAEISRIKLSRTELKKSVKQSFVELIASHAVATPVLRVKLALVSLLKNVQKLGSTTKTKELMPIFTLWASLDDTQAQDAAKSENLAAKDIDKILVSIISVSQNSALEELLTILEQKTSALRSGLIVVCFAHLQHGWYNIKPDAQASLVLKVFELCFVDNTTISGSAQGLLQSVNLSTEALGAILEQSITGITSMQTEEQPRKRRRTSHGRGSLPPDLAKAVDAATARLTLSLELVEGSEVNQKPELMPLLFDILGMLKRLKQQQRLQSPYVLNLCLSSIHSIIKGQIGLVKPNADLATIRADLVTDCIRTSESSQVQNTALSLAASLATIAPDRVLHDVMPIFTFMGQNMFSKEDDHSVHVIYQAINQIVPALVTTLKKHNKDMIKSTSGLMSNFTTAFDHIPQHRRVSIYQQLLSNMDSDDFTFILVAMLAVRKELSQSFYSFLAELLAELPVLTQVITYQRLLSLASDVQSVQPSIATDIFAFNASTSGYEKGKIHAIILETALHISQLKTLTMTVNKLHKVESEKRELLRQTLIEAVRQLLSIIKDERRAGHDASIPKQCLDALLALTPLSQLLSMMPTILSQMDAEPDLKPQILRVLASQLGNARRNDTKTRVAAINLLTVLTRMVQVNEDPAFIQAIIVAIDRLSELYGRKDIGTVLASATTVSGEVCLGSENRRIKIMSLLCLASMFEVLTEASAPIISDIVSKTIHTVKTTLDQQDDEVYAAANSLTSAIISNASFLLSDDDIEELVVHVIQSSNMYDSEGSTSSRMELLDIIARKADNSAVLGALQRAVLSESTSVSTNLESLDLFSNTIENASKAQVIKHADRISQLILAYLDHSQDNQKHQDISTIQGKINSVTIQYIYKLNDTTFRPMFETWIDWATKLHTQRPDSTVQILQHRQTALFTLLAHFFNTLKSIVTSYASYIIAPASTILKDAATRLEDKPPIFTPRQQSQYKATLTMLQAACTHDADSFFATPAHFDPLGPVLISQLKLASSKTTRNLVMSQIIPTIVSLATAASDAPAQHQILSHHITALRHSDKSSIRLASIQTLAALSADENVGDEFVANTIGVGSAGAEERGGGGSSAGELMIYVNEMLEDDDEDVEIEVRKWVQSIREKVGEDVFEV